MLRYLPGSDTRLSHYLVTDSPGSGESGPTRDAAWKKYAAIQSAVCQSALGPAITILRYYSLLYPPLLSLPEVVLGILLDIT